MTSTLVSIGNKTTKVKRPWKGGFCVFPWVLFCGGSFFYIFVKPINFFITKNLGIIYKLSTIREFVPQRKILPWSLFFLIFVTILKK